MAGARKKIFNETMKQNLKIYLSKASLLQFLLSSISCYWLLKKKQDKF